MVPDVVEGLAQRPACAPGCRDTATVLLAVGGASLSVMSLHCRWSSDVMRVSKPVWL
jgi:hypothetical protein